MPLCMCNTLVGLVSVFCTPTDKTFLLYFFVQCDNEFNGKFIKYIFVASHLSSNCADYSINTNATEKCYERILS